MWRFSICILVLHPFFMDRLFIYISACARRYLGLCLRISPGVLGDISALALDSYAFKGKMGLHSWTVWRKSVSLLMHIK